MQEAPLAALKKDFQLQGTIEVQAEISRLMRRTVASLISSFDPSTCQFYTSEREKAKTEKTFRDTAIVLAAIERAGKNVMDRVGGGDQFVDFTSFCDHLQQQIRSDGDFSIAYEPYKNFVFDKAVSQMAEGDPSIILGIKPGDKKPDEIRQPCDYRDAFTSARVLGLLNLYNREETHKGVYVEAVECVVDALTKPYGPHYAFGGASWSGHEAHAFTSYYCIRSLAGIIEILENRKREHQQFSALLRDVADWVEAPASRAKLEFPEWGNFNTKKQEVLDSLRECVGLTAVVAKTLKWRPAPEPTRDDVSALSAELKTEIEEKVLSIWLAYFPGLVKNEIDKTNDELAQRTGEANSPATPVSPRDLPGGVSADQTRLYQHCGGLAWKRAFLEGMVHVLTAIRKTYEEAVSKPSADLQDLAQAIELVGNHWGASAQLTREYVSKFSKWARAEVDSQISLYHVPYRTNFDAPQLAFALRILQDLEPDTNPELIRKGLEILFSSQQEDGVWPVGAPVVFDRKWMQAAYVNNIEIVNAIMPVIMQRSGVAEYRKHLGRIYTWLRTNYRGITSGNTGRKIFGWPTDKILERGRIDVWATAIALEFLGSYSSSLRRDVNVTVLKERYDYQEADKLVKWPDVLDPEFLKDYNKRTTTIIQREYVTPFHDKGESSNSSMILYGPPGTAKTTLAQAIASELGWIYVNITPSDFVKHGIEQSESMARTLFNDLMQLSEAVVLFDEIDEMLRDRSRPESDKGSRQQPPVAMLQFLIPGMLPKLQQLKKYGEKNKLIFIIATNYLDRLDEAVIRPGRIDTKFIMPPPDKPSRQVQLVKLMNAKGVPRGDPQRRMRLAEHLAEKTNGWVYKELEALVASMSQVDDLGGKLDRNELSDLKIEAVDVEDLNVDDKRWKEHHGYKILGLQRSLNLAEIYHPGRKIIKAKEEAQTVIKVCWPAATEVQVKGLMNSLFSNRPPR
jgi:AAA+ superfamily predicted ATPase